MLSNAQAETGGVLGTTVSARLDRLRWSRFHVLLVVALGITWILDCLGVLGLSVLFLRRWVPESPRWLVTHCRAEEADRTVADIEATTEGGSRETRDAQVIEIHPRRTFGLMVIFRGMLGPNRSRSALAFTLMVAQANVCCQRDSAVGHGGAFCGASACKSLESIATPLSSK